MIPNTKQSKSYRVRVLLLASSRRALADPFCDAWALVVQQTNRGKIYLLGRSSLGPIETHAALVGLGRGFGIAWTLALGTNAAGSSAFGTAPRQR